MLLKNINDFEFFSGPSLDTEGAMAMMAYQGLGPHSGCTFRGSDMLRWSWSDANCCCTSSSGPRVLVRGAAEFVSFCAGAGENPYPFLYLFKDGVAEEKC